MSKALIHLIHYISRMITTNMTFPRYFSSQPMEMSMNSISYNLSLENDNEFTELTIFHPEKCAKAYSSERRGRYCRPANEKELSVGTYLIVFVQSYNPRIPTTRSLLRRGYVGSENIRWQWKLRSIRRHRTQTGYSMIWKGVKVTMCNFALCGSQWVQRLVL